MNVSLQSFENALQCKNALQGRNRMQKRTCQRALNFNRSRYVIQTSCFFSKPKEELLEDGKEQNRVNKSQFYKIN